MATQASAARAPQGPASLAPHAACEEGLFLAPALRARVDSYLEPRAAAIDAAAPGEAAARDSLAFLNNELAQAPGASVATPNADLVRVAETIAAAAACDMSTAFSLWCHRMVLEYLSLAPEGSPLRRTEAPALIDTRLFGSTALAAAMAYHVSGAPLPVRWRREGPDLVLDGQIRWASNLFPPDSITVTVAAPTVGGDAPLVVAIPTGTPGFEIQPYPRLLALQATGSSSVILNGVRVPEEAIVAEDLSACITRVRPPFLLLQSSFCLGLAQRALAEARAGLRGVAEIFLTDVETLEQRNMELTRLVRGAATNRGASHPIRQLVQARLDSAQLTTAAVALEAKVAGGRGYVTTSGTARRLREAAFLPVQAPTEGQLRWELSRSA